MDSRQAIVQVIQSQELNELLSKINPEAIRDDLRQEIALALLTLPPEKIEALNARNELTRYVLKICWIFAISDRFMLSSRYKRKELINAMDYLHTQSTRGELPISLAYDAKKFIKGKNRTSYEDHEARIFTRFVELGSVRAVAKYYGIPLNHTANIIKKVKSELRCLLTQ